MSDLPTVKLCGVRWGGEYPSKAPMVFKADGLGENVFAAPAAEAVGDGV